MFPTKERNHPAVYLKHEDQDILFDCGEGTQRQMRIVGISPTKLDKIFISHWHGDHSLGVGGILQSISASVEEKSLAIYGPVGTRESVEHIIKAYKFDPHLNLEVFEIPLKVGEQAKVCEGRTWEIHAIGLKHVVPTLGFKFVVKPKRKINLEYTKKFGLVRHPLLGKLQRGETIYWKGVKITPEEATYLTQPKIFVYVPDTAYFDSLSEFCKEADLLLIECTYRREMKEKASEYKHLTTEDVTKIARSANVKKVVITHLSQRYEGNYEEVLNEIKESFPNVELARDFMEIQL